MPAMMELQLRNHCLNVAGAARSYGIITFNLMALDQRPPNVYIIFKRLKYRRYKQNSISLIC